MLPETLICCIKVGDRYGPEYVNRLAAMVHRHATRPYRFLCLTDNPTGVNAPYTDVGTDAPGWWAKLVLFRPHPALAGRRVLYLDLDTLIMDDMDFLFDYEGTLAILRSFWPPSRYGSALMSIAPGFGRALWSDFERRRGAIMARLYGDQDWIGEQVGTADLWQDLAPGKIGSYKADRLEQGPGAFSICCFHGEPKPHQLTGWVRERWEGRDRH